MSAVRRSARSPNRTGRNETARHHLYDGSLEFDSGKLDC